MLAGEFGPGRQRALREQIEVGEFFDATDFIAVSQVHLMADTESLGESGVEYLEELATLPASQCRVLVPTVTDARGIDLCRYQRIHQRSEWATLERRTIEAMQKLNILLTNTCINYQTTAQCIDAAVNGRLI